MARTQAQRRKTSRSRARRSSSSVEDLMFFPKLRRRAKWVFLLLAIAFGVGFVAFGERPDATMLLGGAVIVGSGIYTLVRSRTVARAALTVPPL